MATPFIVADAAVAVGADLRQYDSDLRTAENSGRASSSRLAEAIKRDYGDAVKVAAGIASATFGVALKGGVDLSNAMARYRAETGATEEEAQTAQKVIGDLYRHNAEGFDTLSGVLAIVHNGMHLVGDDAERASQLILNFARATHQEAVPAANELDGLTKAYNLDAAGQVAILDELVASHQKYGGSLVDNVTVLQQLAPALIAANLTWSDGIGILNLFTKAGVDAAAAPAALTKALSKVHSPAELKRLIADIQSTVDPLERAQKAADLFGVKAGPKLAAALGAGSGGLSEFDVSASDAAGSVQKASDAIEKTPIEWFTVQLHQVLGPLAEFGASLSTPVQTLGSLASAMALFGIAQEDLSIKTIAATIAQKAQTLAFYLQNPEFILTAVQLGILAVAEGAYTAVTWLAAAATTALGLAVELLLGPVGIIILAVGILFAAWSTNFLGIRDIVGGVIDAVLTFFKPLMAGIEVLGQALGAVLGFVGDVVTGIHDFLFGSEQAVTESAHRMGAVSKVMRDQVAADFAPPVALRDSWELAMYGVVGAVREATPAMADAAATLAGEIPTGMERTQASAAARTKAFLAMTIGQQLVAFGPEVIRRGAQISLDLASGLRDKRSAIDAAIKQLKDDMLHPLSRTKEVAHDLGLLFGKTLAHGLKSSDPVIKNQAQGTRALIEAELIETVKAGGKAGQKIQDELEKNLKSKDPAVKAQAQRTKSVIDAALKAQPANTPGEVIGNQLNTDLGNKGSVLGKTAYDLGRTIARNLIAGVKGSGYVGSSVTGSGGTTWSPTKIGNYAIGTNYVPEDMLAYIHKGEIIHSPAESERIRAGVGTRPLIGELNVDARGHPDAAGVGAAVKQAVGDAMADVLRDQSRRGLMAPSL